MKTVQQLPEGYAESCTFDLQNNKKEAAIVNGMAAVIMALMFLAMQFHMPLVAWMDQMFENGRLIPVMAVTAVCTLVYVILHEFTHGVAMKLMEGKEVKYGFTGLYAYAGSSVDYFPKFRYIFIALAPVVLWGAVFAVLQALLTEWTWPVYFLQMVNVSGAAGDIYVSARTARMSGTILVMDTGVNMTVYDIQD